MEKLLEASKTSLNVPKADNQLNDSHVQIFMVKGKGRKMMQKIIIKVEPTRYFEAFCSYVNLWIDLGKKKIEGAVGFFLHFQLDLSCCQRKEIVGRPI